jgi:signal transduction histidine kinase/ActR/RegA family two-component response regulator
MAMSSFGLLVVLPALVVFYVFREELAGKELVLAILLALCVLGFSLIWNVLRSFIAIHHNVSSLGHGRSAPVVADGNMKLREMEGIVDSLNRISSEFSECSMQLQSFVHQFAALAEMTELTGRAPDVADLLSLVLDKAAAAVNARRGSILLLREGEEVLEIVATLGWSPEAASSMLLRDSLVREVIESGAPLLIEDMDLAAGDRRNDPSRYSSPSTLIMPLRTTKSVVGAVCLSEKTTGTPFSGYDQKFLEVLLGQIGLAIENARLLHRAQGAAAQLTKRVRAQRRQIRETERRLLRTEKLSALGQLAGGVAHDFNNLVQQILGYTALTQEALSPEDECYSDLEQVREAAERAAALTSQLLAFGRRQLLQPVDLDLNEIIEGLLGMLRSAVGERIQLELALEGELGVVHADPRQVEQVLLNLCINAGDAMPDGGRVRIETRNARIEESDSESHPGASPGDYVCLSVSDAGCGMDEETLNQIFEPFFTTKPVGEGTGLGLATVFGIVEQHDGIIEVRSQLGRGTTFLVFLPTVNQSTVSLPQRREDVPRGGGETVLVVEDEEGLRNLNVRILTRAGYTVLSASDGVEAVEIFEANAERISLALIDAVMPRLNGREVYARIRGIKPGVGVLIYSGYPDGVPAEFLQSEGLQLLEKPFGADDLLRQVREILDSRASTAA